MPKHCSTRNRRFEIRLLKRFPEARSGRLRTTFLMIPSQFLPARRSYGVADVIEAKAYGGREGPMVHLGATLANR